MINNAKSMAHNLAATNSKSSTCNSLLTSFSMHYSKMTFQVSKTRYNSRTKQLKSKKTWLEKPIEALIWSVSNCSSQHRQTDTHTHTLLYTSPLRMHTLRHNKRSMTMTLYTCTSELNSFQFSRPRRWWKHRWKLGISMFIRDCNGSCRWKIKFLSSSLEHI